MTRDFSHLADDPAFAGNFQDTWGDHITANNKLALPTLSKSAHPHTVLVRQTVDALKRLPGQKIVRKRPVGRFIVADGAGNPRRIPGGKWQYVKVAVAGDSDLELIWAPPGWLVKDGGQHASPLIAMLEAKTGAAVLSDDQKEAREQALAIGCIHIVVRSAAQAFEDVIAAAKAGGGRLV